MTKNDFLSYLHEGDFKSLFIESGWNKPTNPYPTIVQVGESNFEICEVAQQKGFRIFVGKVEKMPDSSTRRLIDTKLRKASNDYLAIYVSTADFHHLWSVPVKTVDKRQLVTIEYIQDDQATFLLEKINAISFSIDDDPTIVDVVDKVNSAFVVNTTDITKKFYQGFRKQHDLFVKGIAGLEDKPDREWYASVMLNRLMFCYFIQKKGFLDLNENYLGDKLKWVQEKKGKDKFYESFYRSFLKQLFSDGLDKPVSGRSDYFLKKYGRIPYLNGGMFALHPLEGKHRDIDIPDDVFVSLFSFFDQWHWHLDNRITASGRDINPDVLGYIFEQYINDRAKMGAYYTKEDITEYIGRNCIVTYLIEAVKKLDSKPFGKNGEVWKTLQSSGDKYIFPAVRKGVDLPLPDYIEIGVSVDGRGTRPACPSSAPLAVRRARWNEKADEAYALPTEIWRETVARRERYAEIHAKIAAGEITDIHDFITYNLDIRAFAEDLIRNISDHRFVSHFYKTLREVTILDPTCGSGAFLFAALNILEPLYEACLDRMAEFHEKNPKLFTEELAEFGRAVVQPTAAPRDSKYFIYKNIILRNLYGVDIMHEATEIARLRLFLKMVAVVDVDPRDENLGLDPLPDIDFNVRCGNTLVGYATEKEIEAGLINGDMFAWAELKGKIEDELTKAAMSFDYFRKEQLNLQGDHQSLVEAKSEVNRRLATIRGLLDDQLYDRHCGKKKAQWLSDAQPFHWYTEFYPIMHDRGGFDVIIGNPPYVNMSQIDYLNVTGFSSPDLYGYVIRRVYQLIHDRSTHGFIVMHNLAFSSDFADVRKLIFSKSKRRWFSFYSRIPSGLFSGDCRVRNTIYMTCQSGLNEASFTTRLHRWYTEQRDTLFNNVSYCQVILHDEIPMIENEKLLSLMKNSKGQFLHQILSNDNKYLIYFKKLAYNFLSISEEEAPCTYPNGKKAPQTTVYAIGADSIEHRDILLLLFSGRFYFAKWCVFGDDLNYTRSELLAFKFPFDMISKHDMSELKKLVKVYKSRAKSTIQYKLNAGKYVGTYNTSKLWDITDKSDEILLKYICDDYDEVREQLMLFVSQMAVTMKKGD